MNSFTFTNFLTSNLNIDADDIGHIINECQVKQLRKDAFLLREGAQCRHTFFVENGLLRTFTIDDKGKEHILQFSPESWFASDRASAYFNEPSKYFIQALEDSRVRLIDEAFIEKLAQHVPSFTQFNNKLLHNHIRQLQERVVQLLSASAEERYLQFVGTYPDILLRVPQTMVASYLGIAPESLSRVRRELARKNFRPQP
jgi:CRP-like cAMP-binding protein